MYIPCICVHINILKPKSTIFSFLTNQARSVVLRCPQIGVPNLHISQPSISISIHDLSPHHRQMHRTWCTPHHLAHPSSHLLLFFKKKCDAVHRLKRPHGWHIPNGYLKLESTSQMQNILNNLDINRYLVGLAVHRRKEITHLREPQNLSLFSSQCSSQG